MTKLCLKVTIAAGALLFLQTTLATANADHYLSCTYQHYCAECHAEGDQSAPKAGDRVAWQPRIDQGPEALTQHALYGWHGKTGATMPARGGHPELTDADITTAVGDLIRLGR